MLCDFSCCLRTIGALLGLSKASRLHGSSSPPWRLLSHPNARRKANRAALLSILSARSRASKKLMSSPRGGRKHGMNARKREGQEGWRYGPISSHRWDQRIWRAIKKSEKNLWGSELVALPLGNYSVTILGFKEESDCWNETRKWQSAWAMAM